MAIYNVNKTTGDIIETAGRYDSSSKVFYGNIASWNNLTTEKKKEYDHASITDSIGGGITFPADKVVYDNTESGLSATDVQEAIDEVKSGLTHLIGYTTVTKTTNEHGSFVLNSNIKVIGVFITDMPSGGSYTYRLGQASNTVYLHLMDEEGNDAANVTITVTYYTIAN